MVTVKGDYIWIIGIVLLLFGCGSGKLAFPQIAATNISTEASAATSHDISLPASISAGDLLIVFIATDGSNTFSWPEGWTELCESNILHVSMAVAYRAADGNEGATVVSTSTNSEKSSHAAYRITGYDGVQEVSAVATGQSTAPNPASLTPSWGSADTLWIAVAAYDATSFTMGYPYADNNLWQKTMGGGTGDCGIAVCSDELTQVSADPGAFTLNASEQWSAYTIAVSPILESRKKQRALSIVLY